MQFQTPLIPATLIRRYKRFLADFRLEDGTEITAHCPNPGGMLGLKDPGLKAWLEPNNDPKKALKYGWRMADLGHGIWAGIDTALPNRVVKEALFAKKIPELSAYQTIKPEQKYGKASRIDFLLQQKGLPDAYLEVKNVNFHRNDDWAEFPDSVTARGSKHLHELADMADAGHRAVMLYLVQHTGCKRFKIAADLDPTYAIAYQNARSRGVEMICYTCAINVEEITLSHGLPIFAD